LLKHSVHAAVGGLFRTPIGTKLVQPAEGRDPTCRAADQMTEPVDVVHALGQQHERGLVLTPPVAADERVCEVPPADRLKMLDRDQLPDRTRVEQALQRQAVRRVPHHVAHRKGRAGPLGGLDDVVALLRRRGYGLLEQQV
jgi:hypothetical protein